MLRTAVAGNLILYSDIQFSDSGMQTFLFQTKERHRVWFNGTFMDHQIASEANLQFEFVQNVMENNSRLAMNCSF
jgi:hypothetical protein